MRAVPVLVATLVAIVGCRTNDAVDTEEPPEPTRAAHIYARGGVFVYEIPGQPNEKLVKYVKLVVTEPNGDERTLTWDQAEAELAPDAIARPIQVTRVIEATTVVGTESFLTKHPPDAVFNDPEITPPECACPCCNGAPPDCFCTWTCLKTCY